MAIVRVATPNDVPLSVSDYQRQNNMLNLLLLALDCPKRIQSYAIWAGAFFNIGGVGYIADDLTPISGTTSPYVKITLSADKLTATASFVANLTGVSWNHAYKGYYDAAGNLYEFDEVKAMAAGAIGIFSRQMLDPSGFGANWSKALGRPAITFDNINCGATTSYTLPELAVGEIKLLRLYGQALSPSWGHQLPASGTYAVLLALLAQHATDGFGAAWTLTGLTLVNRVNNGSTSPTGVMNSNYYYTKIVIYTRLT